MDKRDDHGEPSNEAVIDQRLVKSHANEPSENAVSCAVHTDGAQVQKCICKMKSNAKQAR